MLCSNWTRNNVLLEYHITKTTVRILVYHGGGKNNFKGEPVTLLSYTQPDVSTFCDYDAVYKFWYLSFGKRFLIPSFETRKKKHELL